MEEYTPPELKSLGVTVIRLSLLSHTGVLYEKSVTAGFL